VRRHGAPGGAGRNHRDPGEIDQASRRIAPFLSLGRP
jgi:hypothetical protein